MQTQTMSADFEPLPQLETLQQDRWTAQATYVAQVSAFLQRLWQGKPPPRRLQDLPELPLADKAMLRRSQAEAPPFGDYLAAAATKVVRLHRTSGTTG